MYHLPLLPGYGPGSNIRSSAPPTSPGNEDPSTGFSEAEEEGYQGGYFTSINPSTSPGIEGFIPSASPETATHRPSAPSAEDPSEAAVLRETLKQEHEQVVLSPEDSQPVLIVPQKQGSRRPRRSTRRAATTDEQNFVEAIFFEYGVVVFFGMREDQELSVIEDVQAGGNMTRKFQHDDWEVEACHYDVCCNLVFF